MLMAKRQIEAGEQITFDYGHTWSRFNPRCYCGSESCSGHLSGRLKRRALPKEKNQKSVVTISKKVEKKQKQKRCSNEDPDFTKPKKQIKIECN